MLPGGRIKAVSPSLKNAPALEMGSSTPGGGLSGYNAFDRTTGRFRRSKGQAGTMPDIRQHFLTMTPGKLRGLRQVTDPQGCFRVLALDQSNSFRKALRKTHELRGVPGEPAYEEIRDAKLEFAREIGRHASAVLLDVNYGLRQAISAGAIARGVGLLARVEASRDAGTPGELEPGWSVSQIKRMGADAVKLLVYMDMGDAAAVERQLAFVRQVHDDCGRDDILLLVEELSYRRQDESPEDYAKRKVQNIIESARALGPHCDILKLEFPGDLTTQSKAEVEENIARLDQAAIRPWVLLSAGVDYDLFEPQVRMAMAGGASGIMAGRAIFKEWFEQATPAQSTAFTLETAVPRFRRLCEIVESQATSWQKRVGVADSDLAAAVDPGWYLAEGDRQESAHTTGEY